jgi:hypothetical protein
MALELKRTFASCHLCAPRCSVQVDSEALASRLGLAAFAGKLTGNASGASNSAAAPGEGTGGSVGALAGGFARSSAGAASPPGRALPHPQGGAAGVTAAHLSRTATGAKIGVGVCCGPVSLWQRSRLGRVLTSPALHTRLALAARLDTSLLLP